MNSIGVDVWMSYVKRKHGRGEHESTARERLPGEAASPRRQPEGKDKSMGIQMCGSYRTRRILCYTRRAAHCRCAGILKQRRRIYNGRMWRGWSIVERFVRVRGGTQNERLTRAWFKLIAHRTRDGSLTDGIGHVK